MTLEPGKPEPAHARDREPATATLSAVPGKDVAPHTHAHALAPIDFGTLPARTHTHSPSLAGLIPPSVLVTKIGPVWIALPLFVLWPILFALMPVVYSGALVIPVKNTTPAKRIALTTNAIRILAALRGLRIDVDAKDGTRVFIALM